VIGSPGKRREPVGLPGPRSSGIRIRARDNYTGRIILKDRLGILACALQFYHGEDSEDTPWRSSEPTER